MRLLLLRRLRCWEEPEHGNDALALASGCLGNRPQQVFRRSDVLTSGGWAARGRKRSLPGSGASATLLCV